MSTNNTSNDDFIQVNYTGQEINDAIGAALDTHGIPEGGTTGQVLQKASGTDFDVEWAAQSGGVTSVNGETGVVVLDADDVGALPSSTVIPTKTSDLLNDSGFLTTASFSDYTVQDINTLWDEAESEVNNI